MIYLDYNATTPVDERVFKAMQPFFCTVYGNASSRDHVFGWNAADAVEDARCNVADLIHAQPNEIIFTSGATESLTFALNAVVQKRDSGASIVASATEHDCVLRACRRLNRLFDRQTHYIPVDQLGRINFSELEDRLSKAQGALVAVMLANNETGTIHPLRDIATMVHRFGGL